MVSPSQGMFLYAVTEATKQVSFSEKPILMAKKILTHLILKDLLVLVHIYCQINLISYIDHFHSGPKTTGCISSHREKNVNLLMLLSGFFLQACFASLVSQDYVNGTDQEEIRTGE